jgi:anti-sigma factor ChrR (cupin superfamily)
VLAGLFAQGKGLPHLAWEPFHEGVEIHRLYGGSGNSASAALLKYAPGARVASHDHPGYEHILVLEGAQQDQHGHYPCGTLLINGPGSPHAVFSENGCIVLAIWEKPVDMQAQRRPQ